MLFVVQYRISGHKVFFLAEESKALSAIIKLGGRRKTISQPIRSFISFHKRSRFVGEICLKEGYFLCEP